MDYNKIGAYIQLKRKQAKLTQAELGDKLGVTSKAVSKWECGVALPDVSLFDDLSKILNIEISELLNGEDKPIIPTSKKKTIAIILLTIISIALLCSTLILGRYYIKNKDNVKVYEISSLDKRFSVDGNVVKVSDTYYISITDMKISKSDNLNYCFLNLTLNHFDRSLIQVGNTDLNKCYGNYLRFQQIINSISLTTKTTQDIDSNHNISNSDNLVLVINILDEDNNIRTNEVRLTLK